MYEQMPFTGLVIPQEKVGDDLVYALVKTGGAKTRN